MKMQIKNIIGFSVIALMASCRYGIDPVSEVAPGPDKSSPTLEISYPQDSTRVQVREDVTKITVKFNTFDDIEVGNVVVNLDGKQIASFKGSNYPDYRRLFVSFTAEQITNGDHTMTFSASDLSGNTVTQSVNFSKTPAYKPMPNEVFYMPFDGDANEKVAIADATVTGTPKYAAGKKGKSYVGATGAYITYPFSDSLKSQEMTIAFWYKVKADPDRSGIFTIGTSKKEDRTHGIRLFREGSADQQQVKLNVGVGTEEVWNDGAQVAPNADWVHIAVVISKTNSIVYLNGVPSKSAVLSAPINWDDCKSMTIASGEPTFIYWGHKSDLSGYDEFRIFKKAMTDAEVMALKDL